MTESPRIRALGRSGSARPISEGPCMAESRRGRGAVVHTWQGVNYRLRVATRGDEFALRELIARSIRELGANDYTPARPAESHSVRLTT